MFIKHALIAALFSSATLAHSAEYAALSGDSLFRLAITADAYGIMPITGSQNTHYIQSSGIGDLATIGISASSVSRDVMVNGKTKTYQFTTVGDGQCVAFIKAAVPLLNTSTANWIKGEAVNAAHVNQYHGRVIAIFDGSGKYPSTGGHVAIIRGYGTVGTRPYLDVIDQNWGTGTLGKILAKHRLFFDTNGVANAGNYFYVKK